MKLLNIHCLILRLVVGGLFLTLTYDKYEAGWLTNSDPLRTSLTEYRQQAAGPQQQYLDVVAIPFAGVWSKIILVGEGCLAASLILGLLVRLTTATGLFMLLNFYAANGNLFTWKLFSTPWGGLVFFSLLILLLARAGRWVGFDALFAKSNPKGILW